MNQRPIDVMGSDDFLEAPSADYQEETSFERVIRFAEAWDRAVGVMPAEPGAWEDYVFAYSEYSWEKYIGETPNKRSLPIVIYSRLMLWSGSVPDPADLLGESERATGQRRNKPKRHDPRTELADEKLANERFSGKKMVLSTYEAMARLALCVLRGEERK